MVASGSSQAGEDTRCLCGQLVEPQELGGHSVPVWPAGRATGAGRTLGACVASW